MAVAIKIQNLEKMYVIKQELKFEDDRNSLEATQFENQSLSCDILSNHMIPIYPIVLIQLSFVQFSILSNEFSHFTITRMLEHLIKF